MSPDHLDHKIVDRTKIRDGAVANRPIYVALAVTTEGRRDILGLWAGDGGEGAKHWMHILTEIKNRGVNDVLMLVCDGLKVLPDAVEAVWPRTVVQTCVVHLLRKVSAESRMTGRGGRSSGTGWRPGARSASVSVARMTRPSSPSGWR